VGPPKTAGPPKTGALISTAAHTGAAGSFSYLTGLASPATFGQAGLPGRRLAGSWATASYWATAWDYAGARARATAGRHRRFSGRAPLWRRKLNPGRAMNPRSAIPAPSPDPG
jgi:hypothetical protein